MKIKENDVKETPEFLGWGIQGRLLGGGNTEGKTWPIRRNQLCKSLISRQSEAGQKPEGRYEFSVMGGRVFQKSPKVCICICSHRKKCIHRANPHFMWPEMYTIWGTLLKQKYKSTNTKWSFGRGLCKWEALKLKLRKLHGKCISL